MSDKGGFDEILAAGWRRAWVVAAVAVPLVVISSWYVRSLPEEYEAEAVVAFAPEAETDPAADLFQLLLPRYAVVAASDATAGIVADRTDGQASEIEGSVDAVIPTGTAQLEITVRRPTATEAAEVANATARAVTAQARRDPLLGAATISRARAPDGPASPPVRAVELASVAFALVLGIALAVVADLVRPQVLGHVDMYRHTGLPLLGSVPRSPAVSARPDGALADPFVGAAVRRLRTNLRGWPGHATGRIIAVTAPSAGDGSTAIAALLAVALARTGARTLAVDGNFASPDLGPRLDIPPGRGLSDGLRDEMRLQPSAHLRVPSLWVLQAGSAPAPTDVLAPRLRAHFAPLRDDYDFVVVDAGPLLTSDDARTMAALADEVLLVAAQRSSAVRLREASSVLATDDHQTHALVANKIGRWLRFEARRPRWIPGGGGREAGTEGGPRHGDPGPLAGEPPAVAEPSPAERDRVLR